MVDLQAEFEGEVEEGERCSFRRTKVALWGTVRRSCLGEISEGWVGTPGLGVYIGNPILAG